MAARLGPSLLLISLVLYMASSVESVVARKSIPNPVEFINSSCQATRYPAVCVQSLLGYANVIRQSDKQLAITALSVSISSTKSCASIFARKMTKIKGIKPAEYKAVQDCIENMDDSLDHLSQSVKEVELMGQTVGVDFMWHTSNVQTWVSAAMASQSTCLDGFADPGMDGKLKASLRARVVNVSQVTSNALALVNRFASAHRT